MLFCPEICLAVFILLSGICPWVSSLFNPLALKRHKNHIVHPHKLQASENFRQSTPWPTDAVNIGYVGDWKYWYRTKGMQTSTDDVLVAYAAIYPHICFGGDETDATPLPMRRYVDMGCGIGSTFFLVAAAIEQPEMLVGIEAQLQSFMLVNRSLHEILQYEACTNRRLAMRVLHGDVRTLVTEECPLDLSNMGTMDLVTANPPYAPVTLGTLCKDTQRRNARFEFRGGIEEYCLSAARLLAPRGRFVVSFWHRGINRVERAAQAAGLHITRRLDVVMGSPWTTQTSICIFEMMLDISNGDIKTEFHEMNIVRDLTTGGLSPIYKEIQRLLKMQPRPLKKKSNVSPTDPGADSEVVSL